jgi:predicted membrane-bound spermidine synthase
VHLILTAALITGAASFAYEIAWIRMLSLVLGSSTHSFELMLSAFILGLALGGLWIQRRIDSLSNPVRYLGYVQVVMGLLALLTLPVYDYTFDLMQRTLGALALSDTGYNLFNIVSHAICLLVMLPTTFCAGITLPLMTLILLRKGNGERAIGAVYSFNTVGAILGVLATVHVVMPALGVKGALIAGAVLDVGLALVLLAPRVSQTRRLALTGVAASIAVVGGLCTVLGDLDPRKLTSGVFRARLATIPADTEVVYRRDGKTASIGLVKWPDGSLHISTNGKTDAALSVTGGPAKPDEATMVLAAALPMAIHPQAKLAANIGFGSGLTSHVMLSSAQLQRVDTVEIEPLMVEGARHFGARNSKVYSDPRSRIHIEDAKTFFSAHRERYDIIVSEPSNPWVSGVSSLFSEQFYGRVTQHLAQDGVFVQWLQLYEIDVGLIASVMKALSPHFEDYAAYTTNDSDMLIVARRSGRLGELDAGVLSDPGLAAELERIGVQSAPDLLARKIGSKHALEWMFASYGEPANSDYFPYVDQNAARSRYLNLNAAGLARLTTHPLPLLEMLDGPEPQRWSQRVRRTEWLRRSHAMARASAIRDAIVSGKSALASEHADMPSHLLPVMLLDRCDSVPAEGVWSDAWLSTASELVAYVSPEELEAVWRRVESRSCYALLPDSDKMWFELTRAAGRRDAEAMARLAQGLLDGAGPKPNLNKIRYAVVSGMLGNIVNGYPGRAFLLWNKHGQEIFPLDDLPLDARLLFALSGRPSEKSEAALQQQLAHQRNAAARN